jgi:hypothetical protein
MRRGNPIALAWLFPSILALVLAVPGRVLAEPATGEPPSRTGGTIYFGLGATAVAALSPGAGLSVDLAFEFRRTLLQFGIVGAAGVHDNGTLLLNGSVGRVLSDSDDSSYLLGGIGYLARGRIGGDPSPGPEREHVVLTAEAGYILGRQRRWGQIWGGIRFLVPVATTNKIGTSLPDLPWCLFSVRFLL